MGFWDEINALLGSPPAHPPDTAFPSGLDATAPDAIASALALAEGVTPDSSDVAATVGLSSPSDPFASSPLELIQVQSLRSSPFTILDLNPAVSTGSRKYTSGEGSQLGGPPVPGAGFTASLGTLQQIAKALNQIGISTSAGALAAQGAFPIGVTYPYQVTGTTLRIEQLPLGGLPENAIIPPNPLSFSPGAVTQSSVNTALVGNDVRAQQLLGLFLNGLFLQFETPDAPVFIAKPGETYALPFTRLYVTTFGTANRWRLIVSNGQASVSGFSDDRVLRQQLHMWDGVGVFDNPMIHPVPFSLSTLGEYSGVDQGGGHFLVYAPFQSIVSGFAGNDTVITSNYDSGGFLAQQGGMTGPVVGRVSNKGYKILWITGFSFSLNSSGDISNTQVSLIKSVASPVNHSAAPPPGNFIPVLQFPSVDTSGASGLFNMPLTTPHRLLLAGFDTYDPSVGGVQATGEGLFLLVTGALAAFNISCQVMGYYLPVLSPYSPYPIDPMLLPGG